MADCRPLSTACGDFVSTLSQHAAFKNGRCLETPLCERCASRRSVTACRCLHRRGAGFSPRSRRRLVVGTLPSLGATLPLPRCQPCPSSSPFSIGRDCRLPPASSRDKPPPRWPPQHPVQQTGPCNPRMRARACISPSSALPSLSIPVHQRSASSPRRTQCTARSQSPMRGVNL